MTEQLLIAAIADIEVPRLPADKLADNAMSLAFMIDNPQFNTQIAQAASKKLAEILVFVDMKEKLKIAEIEKLKKERQDKANRYKQLHQVLRAKKEPTVTPIENPILFHDLVTHMTGRPPAPGTMVRSLGVDWLMNDEGTWEALETTKRQTGSKKKPLTRKK